MTGPFDMLSSVSRGKGDQGASVGASVTSQLDPMALIGALLRPVAAKRRETDEREVGDQNFDEGSRGGEKGDWTCVEGHGTVRMGERSGTV